MDLERWYQGSICSTASRQYRDNGIDKRIGETWMSGQDRLVVHRKSHPVIQVGRTIAEIDPLYSFLRKSRRHPNLIVSFVSAVYSTYHLLPVRPLPRQSVYQPAQQPSLPAPRILPDRSKPPFPFPDHSLSHLWPPLCQTTEHFQRICRKQMAVVHCSAPKWRAVAKMKD